MFESYIPYCELCLVQMVPHRSYHGSKGEVYEQHICPYCGRGVLVRKYDTSASRRTIETIPYGKK
ncbi:hypothetical protein EF808_00175 [archaeon]|nr:MAG: hypothetical protein EF808_00175 [archaeon]